MSAPASVGNGPRARPAGALDRRCPECLCDYERIHPRQLFCSEAHKKAWDSRSRLRGRQSFPFAMAARLTRGGERGDKATGRRALSDYAAMVQGWRDDDLAAGRMSMVAYLALRYRLGFDRP